MEWKCKEGCCPNFVYIEETCYKVINKCCQEKNNSPLAHVFGNSPFIPATVLSNKHTSFNGNFNWFPCFKKKSIAIKFLTNRTTQKRTLTYNKIVLPTNPCFLFLFHPANSPFSYSLLQIWNEKKKSTKYSWFKTSVFSCFGLLRFVSVLL